MYGLSDPDSAVRFATTVAFGSASFWKVPTNVIYSGVNDYTLDPTGQQAQNYVSEAANFNMYHLYGFKFVPELYSVPLPQS